MMGILKTYCRCGTGNRNALGEATIDTQKLLFGTGIFTGKDNMGAVALALSTHYQLPGVIFDIAADSNTLENKQRMGIKVKEAKKWGLAPDDMETGMAFLSLEAYTHPKSINLVMKLFDQFRWWQNQFFTDFAKYRKLIEALRKVRLLPLLAILLEKDLTRNTREEVNLYTFKTADYLLSTAQDYRKGYGGDQQHIWQATLGPKAVCFTTHPGHQENTSAGYWVGSGNLPRVAQYKNVLIASYRISRMPGLYMTNALFFTHAWFPKDEFDEVRELNNWVFARKADGYLALTSQNKMTWQTEGEDKDRELIADGLQNIWVCELGNKTDCGSFASFCERIASSDLQFRGQKVSYCSPSQGEIQFGWHAPFKVKEKPVSLMDYPRYDNPYCQAEFAADEIKIERGAQHLVLNLKRGTREVSEFIT
jgi:hypothetical protein